MSEHLTLQTPSERGWAARPGTECGHSEQPLISAREGNINNSFYFPTNFTSPCLLFPSAVQCPIHTPLSHSTWFKIEARTTPKYQDSGRKWGSPQCTVGKFWG